MAAGRPPKPTVLKKLGGTLQPSRTNAHEPTPNGFLPQSSYDGNDYQIHRSGWSVEEMQERGYEVFGINGWKPLRGERALMRWRPRLLWEPISFLTQPLVASRPQRAFQLLCVKTLSAKP